MTAAQWLWVPFRSRRFRARLLVVGLIVSDLYFAFDKWGEVPKLYALICYRQHECFNFREVPDRVVLELDPRKFDGLLERDGYISNTGLATQSGGPTEAVTSDTASDCLDALHRNWGRLNELQPPSTIALPGGPAPPTVVGMPWANAIAFLHQRSAASGQARLVVIRATCDRLNLVKLCPSVYSVARPIGEPVCLSTPGSGDLLLLHARTGVPPMRIFAGQPDRSDSSRFTIAYETNAGRGTVEGRLNGDDSITLKVLDGPAATNSVQNSQ